MFPKAYIPLGVLLALGQMRWVNFKYFVHNVHNHKTGPRMFLILIKNPYRI